VATDLVEPHAPAPVVAEAVARVGHLDVLAASHARSAPDGALAGITAEVLDGHEAVTRARRSCWSRPWLPGTTADGRSWWPPARGSDRCVGEIAHAAATGALAAITPTPALEHAPGIRLNTVNPGPVDTGYATGHAHPAAAARFPAGRWGRPQDTARLVSWLVSDEGRWMVGQVLHSEGGFRRG
jgi:3-oxoacyl-[acyl-carrier protein] reductase